MPATPSNFQNGNISDNPLLVGATTINSAAFADLPEIVAPAYMWLTLDPLGASGDPELTKITAHAAASGSVTVTRGQQGTVARQHALNTFWTIGWTASDITDLITLFNSATHAGDIKATIRSSPPSGWLLLDGTAVLNADVTYPDLWAVAPAAWKSGSTLNLPDMADRVLMDGGSLGASGGANSVTLVTGNLPSHTHAIDHNHGAVTSGTNSVGHTHDIDHNHGAFATADAGSHNHNAYFADVAPGAGSSRAVEASVGAGTNVQITNASGDAGNHAHTIDVPNFSGTSGSNSVSHTHSVDLPNFTGTSGATGSGTAVTTTPSHLRINFIIKT